MSSTITQFDNLFKNTFSEHEKNLTKRQKVYILELNPLFFHYFSDIIKNDLKFISNVLFLCNNTQYQLIPQNIINKTFNDVNLLVHIVLKNEQHLNKMAICKMW